MRNFITGRTAAKRHLPVLFTQRPKISIFAQQGRLVAPIHVKFGKTDGHVSPLDRAKFHANRCPEVGTRTPKWQNFHFLVKSRPAGAYVLTDFYQ